MPAPHSTAISRHGAAIAAELPVPDGYPRTGRAWPSAAVVRTLRRWCPEWPLETIAAVVPGATSAGRDAVQPVTVGPAAWLEELARRCGCDLADVCRGLIPDEELR